MKVTLNIENDEELRLHVKDLIKGQALKIVREELLEIIKAELDRKIKGQDVDYFNSMFKNQMKEAVKEILYKEHNIGSWSTAFVKPLIENSVAVTLGQNFDNIVMSAVKEKIKQLAGQ